MASVKWPGCRNPIRTEYRIILPKDIFHHILFRDKKEELTLKEKLSFLLGITKVRYEHANHPSILLWLEKYCDNKKGWVKIEKTINAHIDTL